MKRRHMGWLVCALAALGLAGATANCAAPPRYITVAQDGSGDLSGATGRVIQQAVDRAHAQRGGIVIIGPGTYVLSDALNLSNKANVSIVGRDGAVLKAAKEIIAVTAADAPVGQKSITLAEPATFGPGARIEIQTPGKTHITPSGKPFIQPFVMSRVDKVEGNTVHLVAPLRYPVPKGKKAIAVYNGVIAHGKGSNLTLENLVIDMNRSEWPLRPINHTYHCAIIATGPYSYEKGPTKPPIEHLRIVNCTIRNALQRGVAFYSVCRSGVYGCTIENTGAEGIDFDHFCYHCEAVGNELTRCHNIELNDASDCLIASNTMTDCGAGIAVWQWCKLPDLNVRNVIMRNRIVGSRSDGIRLQHSADFNTVVGNTVQRAARHGILVQGMQNVISGNTVEACGSIGIRLEGEANAALRNRCTGNSRAKPGTNDGISLAGSRNRAEDNVCADTQDKATQRYGVKDEGKANTVRGNSGAGNQLGLAPKPE